MFRYMLRFSVAVAFSTIFIGWSAFASNICESEFLPQYNQPQEWNENLAHRAKQIKEDYEFKFHSQTLVNFAHRARVNMHDTALQYKVGGRRSGEWKSLSWHQYEDKVSRAAAKLKALGVEPGERIALMSEARWEWAAVDLAVMANHGISVGVGADLDMETQIYILNNSQSTTVFVEDEKALKRLLSVRDQIPNVKKFIVMESENEYEDSDVLSLQSFFEFDNKLDLLEEGLKSNPQDIMALSYTSGTSGLPKGVVVTQNMIQSTLRGIYQEIGDSFGKDDTILSFLPQSHIFGKIEHLLGSVVGWKQAYAQSKTMVIFNMAEVKPSIMFAAPKVAQKIYESLLKQREDIDKKREKAKGFKKISPRLQGLIFDIALWANEKVALAKEGLAPRPNILLKGLAGLTDALAFKTRLRVEKMGGNLRYIIVGSAKLPVDLARFMRSIGVEFREGYGSTETMGASFFQRPEEVDFGNVGQPIDQLEVKISTGEDGGAKGEILLRGPQITPGYWQNSEATKKAFTGDGWYRTGDAGNIDEQNRLVITGRISRSKKGALGEFVNTEKLEQLLSLEDPVAIEQVYITINDKATYPVALIVVNKDNLKGLSKAQIQERVDQARKALNKKVPQFETIGRFEIINIDDPVSAKDEERTMFTIENGMLTNTQKLRPKAIEKQYRELLDRLLLN